MGYKVRRSEDCDHDLRVTLRHLVESYMGFGDTLEEAFKRATRRVGGIEDDMEALAIVPHQGSLEPAIRPGLRHVTKNRAVFYFYVDDEREIVQVVAVFLDGQEHRKRMLKRLKP